MDKFKLDKKAVLTGLSALFGIGAFFVNVATKKNEMDETAAKAAKIVMDNMSKED